jgi:hypothetical protein
MKRIITLTESDLTRIIRRIIKESKDYNSLKAKYVTQFNHNLIKNGKTTKILKGDIWSQQGAMAETLDFMVHEKSGIVFHCGPKTFLGIAPELNLVTYENSKPLIDSLRSKFCKGNSFNYDKYPSSECIEGEKMGRDMFVGCTDRYTK